MVRNKIRKSGYSKTRAVSWYQWHDFIQACESTDIGVLQKTLMLLDFGNSFYGLWAKHGPISGLNRDPHKFRSAAVIVRKIITKKLKSLRGQNALSGI